MTSLCVMSWLIPLVGDLWCARCSCFRVCEVRRVDPRLHLVQEAEGYRGRTPGWVGEGWDVNGETQKETPSGLRVFGSSGLLGDGWGEGWAPGQRHGSGRQNQRKTSLGKSDTRRYGSRARKCRQANE